MRALNVAALGLQSSAIQRCGVGLSITYLAGSLTTVIGWLISGHKLTTVAHSLAILLGLIVGAGIGTVLPTVRPSKHLHIPMP